MKADRLWNRSLSILLEGQVVSSIGTQAFALAAMPWLKELTGSGTLMDLILTAALLPMVALGPISGIHVDRRDRRRLSAWRRPMASALPACRRPGSSPPGSRGAVRVRQNDIPHATIEANSMVAGMSEMLISISRRLCEFMRSHGPPPEPVSGAR